MQQDLKDLHHQISHHPLFHELKTAEDLRIFMQIHVFAVWDFMSLLKRLQRDVTCVSLPWRPSPYPASMVRLINQIVIGEESDVDPQGHPISHFELYLKAMEEVGADTSAIRAYVESGDSSFIPQEAKAFVSATLHIALEGEMSEVASCFFWGREKLIPAMFTQIELLLCRENLCCPQLLYYLKRHIEIDGDEHGPMAEKFLETLGECEKMASRNLETHKHLSAAKNSLLARQRLWDLTLESILINRIQKQKKSHNPEVFSETQIVG